MKESKQIPLEPAIAGLGPAEDRPVTGATGLLREALEDPDNGWSVGTFGAIGEFVRDPGEGCSLVRRASCTEIVTARGALRVFPHEQLRVIAYETFVGDGETWGNTVAFCLARPQEVRSVSGIRWLGEDADALRPGEQGAPLFDLGVGIGAVSMLVRSTQPELIAALQAAEGEMLMSPAGAVCGEMIRRLSPVRVLRSPVARLEVYGPIPPVGGKSPAGPHTHLLPKLLASRRTHSANAPIPEGLQPVLSMHPRSAWRDHQGRRLPYDPGRAAAFDGLVRKFGLEEDQVLRERLIAAVKRGADPASFPLPGTRHGRMQMRIILRRLTQELGAESLDPWRMRYDGLEASTDAAELPEE